MLILPHAHWPSLSQTDRCRWQLRPANVGGIAAQDEVIRATAKKVFSSAGTTVDYKVGFPCIDRSTCLFAVFPAYLLC
jgi:hypothetical protein